MKILHISKYYPPYSGGIEDVCYNLVKSLSEEEQKVICFNDVNSDNISCDGKVEIIRIGSIGELASQPISFSYYHKLKVLLKTYVPDIIHLHLPNPLLCFYVLLLIHDHTKLVLHWHSDIVAQKYIYRLFAPIETRILCRADKILVTSPQYLEDSLPLAPYKEKSIIVPNVISLDKLEMKDADNDKVKKLKEVYWNKKIIFFMGRHVPYKGIEYLIEAEKYIQSDCIIFLAGKGPLTSSLREISKSNRIKFLGRISDDDVKMYMNAADIFAFPSITKNEAFGVVLAEAMYCKAVPVCFTIQGSGVNWVNVNNVTGLEVPNRDAQAFGKAIDLLLTNDKLRAKLSDNAHQRVVDMFTIETVGKQLRDIYKKLVL